MTQLKPSTLFNPEAIGSEVRMIGGESTGILILNDNKYDWTAPLYKVMMQNFWIPESIALGKDAGDYKSQLTNEEREAFDKVFSFLVFMDSLLTSAIPNLADYVTAPEVKTLLAIHAFQEALHSQSYGYVVDSVIPAEKRRYIYDIALTDPHLRKRNAYIANFYQSFIDNPTPENFVKVAMANYLLEGIYFYAGFAFVYNLNRYGKLTGVGTEIKYINRDEITHLAVFQGIFRELRKENPEIFTKEMNEELREMCRQAVEHEVEWSDYAFGEGIQGLNPTLIRTYMRYISNSRLRNIGLEPIWPELIENPIMMITKFSEFNGTKTDFFEEHVINYAKAGGDLGLDNLDDIDL